MFPEVPGYMVPLSEVSTKNWVSNTPGVESSGDSGTVVSMWLAAATECLPVECC